MYKKYTAIFMALLATGHVDQIAAAPVEIPSDDLSFEEQVAFFSEEKLGIRPFDKEIVTFGVRGCEISDVQRAKFDNLLPISSKAAKRSVKRHADFGLPVIDNNNGFESLLYHNDYVISYNTNLRVPLYASYRLDKQDIVTGNRRDCFREDQRLITASRSTYTDYDEPIYDRGHLVPVGDMHRKFSTSVNTFYYSNMMPQSARFNQGVWKFLEASVRLWAVKRGSVHVLTGAIFDENGDGKRDPVSDAERIKPKKRVAKPTHFFKILIHKNADGALESMAFLLPHTFKSIGKSLPYIRKKLTTIDEIEALAGYDFFPDLPAVEEKKLEAFKAPDIWLRRP